MRTAAPRVRDEPRLHLGLLSPRAVRLLAMVALARRHGACPIADMRDGTYYVQHFCGPQHREDTRLFNGPRLNQFMLNGWVESNGTKVGPSGSNPRSHSSNVHRSRRLGSTACIGV